MEQVKLGGYIPDPKSDRDLKFVSLSSSLTKQSQPGTRNIIKELTPVSNQGRLSSCVANATVDALEILMGIQDPSTVQQLSRLFVYFNARNYDYMARTDAGTYIRNAFRSIKEFGVCREETWSYDQNNVYLQPPINSYKEASDNRITGFYRIDSLYDQQMDDIINALDANHPVVFGTAVSFDFTQTFWGPQDVTFDVPKASVGDHAMIIVGYETTPELRFYVRNSWGSGWGDGTGHCWMTANYIKSEMTSDLWVPTMIPRMVT